MYDIIVKSDRQNKSGESGKMFVMLLMLAKVRQDKGMALAVASSGIADTVVSGIRTALSIFKLGLNVSKSDILP